MIKAKESILMMGKYYPPLEGRRGKLRLDFNENVLGCSPKVVEAIRNLSSDDISTYPEYGAFLQKLSGYLCVGKDEIIPTNGGDEAIKIVIDTYLSNEDEILIPYPTFDMFRVYAEIAGGKVNQISLNEDLSFPTERFISAINERTKIVVLVNPNNPTGTVIDENDIEKIAKAAKDSIVIIDEAYSQFYGKSAKELIRKYDNIIVIQSFSKAFGLAGIRLGCIISNKCVVETLRKCASPYSVNNIAIAAGTAALSDMDFVNKYVDEVKRSRGYIQDELNKMGIKTYPSQANFILAYFGNKSELLCRELRNRGILVRDRSKSPLISGCVRLGIGTLEQSKMLVDEINRIVCPDTILFDIDGVLADVSNSYRTAIKSTVEYFTGKEITSDKIQDVKLEGGLNNDWDLTFEIIKREGTKVEFGDVKAKFQEIYLGRGFDGLIVNEGLLVSKYILEKLSLKYKLGIVTGRPKQEAEFFLRKNGILEFFDCLVCMEDTEGMGKPDPFGINLALDKIGKENAYYIGDSVDDIEAANKAGIIALGVLPPYVDRPSLKKCLIEKGGAAVFEDADELYEVLR